MIKVGDFVRFKTPPDCDCSMCVKILKEGGVVSKVCGEDIEINYYLFYMSHFYVENDKTILKSIEWI